MIGVTCGWGRENRSNSRRKTFEDLYNWLVKLPLYTLLHYHRELYSIISFLTKRKIRLQKVSRKSQFSKSRETRPWNWVVATSLLDISSELVFHLAPGVHPGLSLYNLTHLAYMLFLFTSSQSFNFLLFFVITEHISPHSQDMQCLHSSISVFIPELQTIESDSTIMWFL